jgi:hypothetical protein
MRSVVFLALGCLLATTVHADVSYIASGGQIQRLDSVSLRPSDPITSQAIDEGRGHWAPCPGLPHLFKGSTGDVVIDVIFEPAPVSTAGCGRMVRRSQNGQLIGGTIYLFATSSSGSSCDSFRGETMGHEIGHIWGLANSNCPGYLMAPPPNRELQTAECGAADDAFLNDEEFPDAPPGSDPATVPVDPSCTEGCSPILIDVEGKGFRLTGLDQPVIFDLDADGLPERISWTHYEARNGFLTLDRNGNGHIDSGAELFGTATEQPESDEPNGFKALAVLDAVSEGGDGDGAITPRDAVYDRLRLWFDWNHNGRSDRGELLRLAQFRIRAIGLEPVTAQRRDRHGNLLRWASWVEFDQGRRLAAVDVIFRIDTGEDDFGPRHRWVPRSP